MAAPPEMPSVDVFYLTFNAGKSLIDAPVLARYLCRAFARHGDSLPDLVVFSLQEMAPLAQAFAGSYLLNPYFARYVAAVNGAATAFLLGGGGDEGADRGGKARSAAASAAAAAAAAASSTSSASPSTTTGDAPPYTLTATRNVGMTGLMLLERRRGDGSGAVSEHECGVRDVRGAEVGFGAGDMANKGAVGLRFLYRGGGGDGRPAAAAETELTFVGTHLQAMEWNLETRNRNWATIMSDLIFEGDLLAAARQQVSEGGDRERRRRRRRSEGASGGPDETRGLLADDDDDDDDDDEQGRYCEDRGGEEGGSQDGGGEQSRLRSAGIYRASSHLFVAGDLNYRIAAESPPSGAAFPPVPKDYPYSHQDDDDDDDDEAAAAAAGSREEEARWQRDYAAFFAGDQLTAERRAGRALHGLSEQPVRFAPTYKLKMSDGEEEEEDDGGDDDDDDEHGRDQGKHKGELPSWTWATHRWPGWCDRVLYLDVPPSPATAVSTEGQGEGVQQGSVEEAAAAAAVATTMMRPRAYDALPPLRSSDHRPVFLRVDVPLLAPGSLERRVRDSAAAAAAAAGGAGGGADNVVEVDPRARLPADLARFNAAAPAHRAAVRRWERALGWALVLASGGGGGASAMAAAAVVVVLGGLTAAWWVWG